MSESTLEFWSDALEIVWQQLEHEVPRSVFCSPWTVVLFVRSEQDALAFLACVNFASEVDHVWQLFAKGLVVIDDFIHWLGHQVVVFHCQHWQFNSNHATNFACPQTTGVHNVFRVDLALVGVHGPRAVLAWLDVVHHGVGVHLCSAVTCANCVCVSNSVWVY